MYNVGGRDDDDVHEGEVCSSALNNVAAQGTNAIRIAMNALSLDIMYDVGRSRV